MKYTEKLNLPIYDTPETDLFRIQDWNNGNTKVEQAYDEMLSYNSSEVLRVQKEQERILNETNRTNNETTRISSEENRITSENTRKQNELNRIQREQETSLREQDRITNENNRVSLESERADSETLRNIKEEERIKNETERISKESERQIKEQDRVISEEERKTNELARQSVYKEIQDARKDFNGVTRDNLEERLSSDLSYVNNRFNNASLLEYDNKYISASKSYDGITKYLKIKGRTLQNLATNSINFLSENNNLFTITNNSEYYKIVKTSEGIITWKYASISLKNLSMIKPNTTYTIFTKMNKKNDNGITIIRGDITNSLVSSVKSNVYENGLLKTVITTKPTFDGIIIKEQVIYIGMTNNFLNALNDEFIIYKNITMVEGDYTTENIPYFEGIKSVGEEGKLDVVSCGKNLFDLSKVVPLTEKVTVSNDKIFIKNIYSSYNNCDLNKKLKPNTKYYISRKIEGTIPQNGATGRIAILNVKNNNILTLLSGGYDSVSSGYFTTPNDIADYSSLLMYGNSSTDDIVFSNIIISEVETPYEPYKETKIPITLNAPLRSLPNGIKDELDIENGKIIRRIGKVILNGSENWNKYTTLTNTICFSTPMNLAINYTTNPNRTTINSNFYKIDSIIYDLEGWGWGDASPIYYIRINKNKLATQDVAGFKAWLQANPTTVYYELESPIEELIMLPNNLRTYDGTTNIFTEGSLIEPNVYAKIPSDVIALTDIRNSTVKSKIFANADARVEELEQDVKNIVTQEAWIMPTLTNGWSNAPGLTTRYMKENTGFVNCEINITGGTIGTSVFQLPVGYRPSQVIYANGLTNTAKIYFYTDGTINYESGSTSGNSRFNCRFRIGG